MASRSTRKRFVPLQIKKKILRQGVSYQAAPLPEDIQRGPTGKCFDWCMMQALNSQGKYRYVEGFASAPYTGVMTLHAWLTDGIHAFDPTWGIEDNRTNEVYSLDLRYIGVEMNLKDVMIFVRTTTYQGLLGNRWRWPELVDELIEKGIHHRA